jgi:DNA-directed RNA polymerase subunit RPC12/RpoP
MSIASFPFHLFFGNFYNCNFSHQTVEITNVYVISKKSKLTKRTAVKRMNLKNLFKCKSEKIDCSVCCSQVEENEYVRELPCGHKFHKKCVDEWLFLSLRDKDEINCPMCRHKIRFR